MSLYPVQSTSVLTANINRCASDSLVVVSDRVEFLAVIKEAAAFVDNIEDVIAVSHQDVVDLSDQDMHGVVICDLVSQQDHVVASVFHLAEIQSLEKTIFLLNADDRIGSGNWLHVLYRLNASSCVSSQISTEELLEHLQLVKTGYPLVSEEFGSDFHWVRQLDEDLPVTETLSTMTLRQVEVLSLLASGQNVQQVSRTLGLSIHAVESHKDTLLKCIGCENVLGLCQFAISYGLSA